MNVNLEGWQGKAREFDQGSRPVVGTFDYIQVPGLGTFEFPLITNSNLVYTVKDLVASWLPVQLPGGLVTKDAGSKIATSWLPM